MSACMHTEEELKIIDVMPCVLVDTYDVFLKDLLSPPSRILTKRFSSAL